MTDPIEAMFHEARESAEALMEREVRPIADADESVAAQVDALIARRSKASMLAREVGLDSDDLGVISCMREQLDADQAARELGITRDNYVARCERIRSTIAHFNAQNRGEMRTLDQLLLSS